MSAQPNEVGLPEDKRVTVKLVGEDGNAFAILGRVSKALKRAGMPEKAKEYTRRATEGDYNHLLMVTLQYVEEPAVDEDGNRQDICETCGETPKDCECE